MDFLNTLIMSLGLVLCHQIVTFPLRPDFGGCYTESCGTTAVKDLCSRGLLPLYLAGDHADGAESSRPGSVYVPEWTIHRSLRPLNADQASHIKELEAELARKDSALVFSYRVSNERAVENERLVSKLGYLEKEKTDSIRGSFHPTVVRRLLNSHEYKESLSIPFNLAFSGVGP
ncbi:hypothetical protein Tco_1409281 [Tanacetum coccineum]